MSYRLPRYFILEDLLRSRPSLYEIAAAAPSLDHLQLAYPLDQCQGPFGAVPTAQLWLYGMFWASGVVTGFVPFDITPGSDGTPGDPDTMPYVGFTLAILFVALLLHGIIISTFTSAVLSVDNASQFRKQRIDRVVQYLQFQGVEAALRARVVEFYKCADSPCLSATLTVLRGNRARSPSRR